MGSVARRGLAGKLVCFCHLERAVTEVQLDINGWWTVDDAFGSGLTLIDWSASVGHNAAGQFLWEVRVSPETIAAESNGAAILSRVLKAHASSFTPEAARSILQLKFDQIDTDRMNTLAEKNRHGMLTEAEQQELQSYLLVGHLLDLLHSKARLALKQTAS
jgi:hypothetical protein